MGLLDILKQYSNSSSAPTGDVVGHYDAVAQQASPQDLGGGIAAAMRSDATPSFGQTIGSIFSQSNPNQKAGVLNELLQALGPAGLAGAGGGILGRILGPGAGLGTPTTVTPAQATQVSPTELSTIASSAERQDGSIVDRMGQFYAQHPTLVKTLGVAAMAAVMSHMSSQRSF
ncbi:MAG TPA: hypothetical protein VGD63_09540 [Steroidobacteraceae bacterium]